MKRSILNQLARRSMTAHRSIFFPFYLATSVMFALLFILLTLMGSDYVRNTFSSLPTLLSIGLFFGSILVVIITLYTSRFIQENQLEEFGVYSVLGLEKKDILWINFLQTLTVYLAVLLTSFILGTALGYFSFIFLNRLMKDTGATFMDFNVNILSVAALFLLVTVSFFLVWLMNAVKIYRLQPLALLQESDKAQSEPRSRWFLLILGIALTLGGYAVAWEITKVRQFVQIFLAVLLVLLGTYALFLSLSTIILKWLRRRKSFYYQTHHFLTIGGMLHRLSSNAVSLATIAILATGSILLLGSTVTLYQIMEDSAQVFPRDYVVTVIPDLTLGLEQFEEDQDDLMEDLTQDLVAIGASDVIVTQNLVTGAQVHGNRIDPFEEVSEAEMPFFVIAESLKSYNAGAKENETLEPGQILVDTNYISSSNLHPLYINGIPYETKAVDSPRMRAYAVEAAYIVFATEEELRNFQADFMFPRNERDYLEVKPLDVELHYNLAEEKEGQAQAIIDSYARNDAYESAPGLIVESRADQLSFTYSLYGGLLFIGIIVSAILLISTVLMLYFKQLGEGYADRENFQIMKKVGLSEGEIKRTIRTQVLAVFFLPLLVAIIHNLVALRPLSVIFRLVGLSSPQLLYQSFLGVLIAFALIYFIFYLLTSRSYYQIVNR